MCGAVSFTATDVPDTFGACHCDMCRRWTGSAMLGVTVPEAGITWKGEAQISTLQSSAWAERAWCRRCGSPVYFRMTTDNEYSGTYEIPLGMFDDPNGFRFANEIYIDQKPDSFAYAPTDRTQRTRAYCVSKFPALDDE